MLLSRIVVSGNESALATRPSPMSEGSGNVVVNVFDSHFESGSRAHPWFHWHFTQPFADGRNAVEVFDHLLLAAGQKHDSDKPDRRTGGNSHSDAAGRHLLIIDKHEQASVPILVQSKLRGFFPVR